MWTRYRLPCALGLLVLVQFTIGRSLQFPDSISDKRNSPEENKDVYDRGIESAIRDENPPPRRPPGCCTPELHLGFDDATDDLVVDSHDVHRAQSRAVSTVDAPCSNYADLNVDVVQFESAKFAKVTDAITIAIWVNLKTISGIQPILLIKGLTGELRFEIAQGHVTWLYFARRPSLATFALLSPKPVVATETWTHLVAQYDAHSNRAAVFVNGEEILQSKSNGESVEITWSEFTTIGKYSINEELEFKLTGHIDEFYIYYCALPEMVIQKLYQMCHMDGKCAPGKPDDGELCDVSAFHCKNGKCIRQAWRCDSENDCGDWSDEIGCDGICGPDEQPSASQRQCVSCFCMGRSQNCSSANFYRDELKIQLTNERSPPVMHLVDINGSDVSNITYTVDQLNNGVVAHNASKGTEYYWTLPKEFLGNKLSSYGGKLRYTVNFIAGNGLTDRYAKNTPRHIRSLREIINSRGFVASYAIYDVLDEEPTDSGGSGIEDPSVGDSGQVTSTPKTQSTDSQVTKMTTNLQETTSEPDKDTEMVIDQDDRHTSTHGAKPDPPTPAATPNGTSILTKSETTPLLILKTHPSERLPSTADLPTSETLAMSSTGTDAFTDGEDGTITFVPPPASITKRPTSETVSTIPDTSFTATDVLIDVQDEKTTFQPSSAYNSYSPTSEEATTRPDTSSTKADETTNGQDETTPAYTTDSLTLKTLTTLPDTFLPKTDTSTKDQGETGQDDMSSAIPFSAFRTEKPAPDTVTIIPDMFYTPTDAATEGQGESATNEPSSPYSSDAPTSESVTTIPDTLYAKTDASTDDQDEATTFVSSAYRPTAEKVTTKPDTPYTVTSSSTDDLEEKNTTERPSTHNTDVPTSETIATIPETSHTTADGSYDAQHDTTLVPSSAYSTERPTSDTSYMSSPTNDQSETTISVPSSPHSTNRPTPETVTTMQDTVYTTTDTLTDGLHETTIKTIPDALHTTRDTTDGQDYITTNEPPSAYKTDKQTLSTVTTIPSTLQTTADASTDGQGESTTAEPPSAYSTDSRTSEPLTTIAGTFYVTDPSTDSENDATISVPSSPYSTDKPTSETVTTMPDTVYTTTDTDGLDDTITTAPSSAYSTDAPTSETVTTIPDVVYTTLDTPSDGQDETTISVPSSPYSTDRPAPETVTTMPDTVYRTTETPTDGLDETTTTAPSSAYSTDGSTSETVTTIPDTLHTATDTTDGQDYITTTGLPSVYSTDKQIFSTVTTIPSTLQTPTAALTADGQAESTTTESPSAYSTDSPTSETLTTIPDVVYTTTDTPRDGQDETTISVPSSPYSTDRPTPETVTTMPDTVNRTTETPTDGLDETTTTAPSSAYSTDGSTSETVTTIPDTLHTATDTTDGQDYITTTGLPSVYSTDKQIFSTVTTIPSTLQTPTAALTADGQAESTTTEPPSAYSTDSPTSETLTTIQGTFHATDSSTDSDNEATTTAPSSTYRTDKPTSQRVTTLPGTLHTTMDTSTDGQEETTTFVSSSAYSTKKPVSDAVTTIPDGSTDGLDETTTTEPSLAYSTEEPTSDTATALLGTLYTTTDTSTDGQDEMTTVVPSSAYNTAKPTSDTVTTTPDISHTVTSVSTDDQDKTTTTEPPLSYSTKRPISERVTATATVSSTTSREGTTSEATTPTSEPAIKCRVGHEFYPVNSVFVTKSCTSRCSCLEDGSLRCAPLCIEDVPLCEDNEKEVESRKSVENSSCVCVEKRCVRVDDATKTTPAVTQTTVAPTPTPGQVTDAVQLVGKDGTLVFYPEVQPSTGKYQTTMEVSLTEAKWRSSNGAPTSRDTFMRVLSDIQAIYVKAQYGDDESRAVSLSIKEISLDISSQHNKGFGKTLLVEQCECPVGYGGLSCEYCSPGYTRSSDGLGCMKCLCNEHSDVCDQENGTCLGCRHNTEGLHCDRCQSGYFGNALKGTPTDCQPCPCPLTLPPNQFSSTCFLGKDGLPTCDACPVGYAGRNCELCAVNFTGNPMIHHSKCKLAVSELKECDSYGSLDIKPDNSTQKCLCKANVHGVSCDTCKPGFFNLEADNPKGCTPCFCNEVTDSCQSAMLSRTQIRSTFSVNELMNFTLVRLDQTPVNSSDLFVNPLTKELTFQSFVVEGLQGTILYWKLPQEYTGNKVTSYGGILNHVISFVASSDGELIPAPDIILVGKYSSIYHFKETFAQSNEETAYGVEFNEHFWKDGNGGVISRDQLIMALHQVEALLIRASYNTRMLQATLREVSMDIATNDITNQSRVTSVEQCACPLEYQGLSCESCKPGFYRSRVGPYLGTCVKCKCHGHARDNFCDPETGECKNCQHNTVGFRCEKCLTGFYGNATIGKPSECKPCPCPMTSPPNRFSPTCFMAEDGQPTCDACPPGYGGRRCDRCIVPYVGNPTEPGGNCKLELDCGCDVRGSINNSCDPVTRQCFCKKACPGCIGIVFRYQNV